MAIRHSTTSTDLILLFQVVQNGDYIESYKIAGTGIFFEIRQGRILCCPMTGVTDFKKMLFIFIGLRGKERRVTTDIYDVP